MNSLWPLVLDGHIRVRWWQDKLPSRDWNCFWCSNMYQHEAQKSTDACRTIDLVNVAHLTNGRVRCSGTRLVLEHG